MIPNILVLLLSYLDIIVDILKMIPKNPEIISMALNYFLLLKNKIN